MESLAHAGLVACGGFGSHIGSMPPHHTAHIAPTRLRAMRSVLLLLCLAPAIVHAQSAAATVPTSSAATSSNAHRVERAYFAWEAGRYVEALEELKRVLASPDASAVHDRIAELTGETWQTAEVAKDARAPRWSPDGRHLSYEVGAPSARRVRIVRTTTGFPVVLDTPGASPSFAADGQSVAWLSTGANGRAIVRWMPLGETSAQGNVQDIPLDAAAATSLTLVGRAPLRLAVLAGTTGDSTELGQVQVQSASSCVSLFLRSLSDLERHAEVAQLTKECARMTRQRARLNCGLSDWRLCRNSGGLSP